MHLRVLAQLAGRIDDPQFMTLWMNAPDHQRIKESVIHPDRVLSIDLSRGDEFGMIGTRIEDVSLPQDVFVALVGRHGELLQADPGLTLRDNDRITVLGEPETIARLADKAS
jgi:Trk K+ transport system NAD-binding subunit